MTEKQELSAILSSMIFTHFREDSLDMIHALKCIAEGVYKMLRNQNIEITFGEVMQCVGDSLVYLAIYGKVASISSDRIVPKSTVTDY